MRVLIASVLVCMLFPPASVGADRYFVAGGAALDYYGTKSGYAWVSTGVRVTGNGYAWSSTDLSRDSASVRAGYGRLLARSGRLLLIGVLDGGPAVSSSDWGAAFSGGFVLGWNLHRNLYLGAGMRIVKSTIAGGVQPVAGIGFGVGF